VFLLGHLGIGLGLAWVLAWRTPNRIPYNLVLLGAILPDLIDKPLGVALGLETRLWGHTFLFLGAILVASFVPQGSSLRFLGFGVATHLLLDSIWQQPDIVLYPIAGWWFPASSFEPGWWFDTLLRDPVVQAGEVSGLLLLAAFAWTHGLRSWAAIRAFVGRGTLPTRPAS